MKFVIAVAVLFSAQLASASVIIPVCSAVNGRGVIFSQRAILNPQAAQQAAMRRCYQAGSVVCKPLGCR